MSDWWNDAVASDADAPAATAGAPGADVIGVDVTDGTDPGEQEAAQLIADIETLQRERDDLLDTTKRLQADFENYRKRIAVQTTDEIQRATSKIAEALLPILDACEAAFVLHPREIEPLFNSLLTELKKVGLEAMHLSDQPFDPNVAEAVMHEPGDTEHPVVTEVMRSGYTWQGKVLRPAMVKVRG